MRTKFYFSLFVAFIIIIVNYYANYYQVYWLFPWFDIPMHISGGFMVALFAQTGIDHLLKTGVCVHIVDYIKLNKRRIIWTLLSVVAVGVFWEFVEWFLGVTDGLGPISRLDTIKDVFDDIIGGVLGVWFWNSLFNKKYTKINDKQQSEQ
ncbi:MAG: hypothetical protein WCO09_02850 [bacterium]